jgi:hypothetical protein
MKGVIPMINKIRTTISISPILLEKAQEYSKLNTISVSTLITLALNEYLEKHIIKKAD